MGYVGTLEGGSVVNPATPSGLSEFFEVQVQSGRPGTAGWWEQVLPYLDEERVNSLYAAARSREISHRTIAVVLGQWGYEVTAQQVGHWRRNHVR